MNYAVPLLLAPDSCYLHPFKPVRRTGLVTGKKSGRVLAKQSVLLLENTNNVHEICALSQNLRGRNIQGKQIATSP